MRGDHLLAWCTDYPWAITDTMLSRVATILAQRIAGKHASEEAVAEVQAAVASRSNLATPAAGAVAIIPVYGVLAPKANMITEASGMASYQQLGEQIREAVATDSIAAIVLDIDSPGGSVQGCTELAQTILQARKQKPIVAQASGLMASAAYHLGSCASEIIASPSSIIGSIGVFTIHDDLSKALAMEGIDRKYIVASGSPNKVEDRSTGPLSPEAEARIQGMVDDMLATFQADVAKGRGVSIDVVRSDYGKGSVMLAKAAKAAGMVDAVGTLDETVKMVAGGKSTRQAAQTNAARTPDRLWRAQIEYAFLET